ncbi:MAG: hypothetical protein R8P61_01200 [Bacteroidia bacterium]|nr:hypothetical protein [Bacteroidia bacterium]
MNFKIYSSLILLICLFSKLFSQTATDIYLLDLDLSGEQPRLENPRNITDRQGYDNQASFSPDSKSILYTSIRAEQADIFRYFLDTKEVIQICNTPATSEYSPKIMPGGKAFSVVRVEADGKTQRLWKFSLKNGKAKLLMSKVQPIGYYTWYKKGHLAMFILGSPNTLKYTKVKSQKLEGFDFNLGRSIHTIPSTELVSFVDKSEEDSWLIRSWDSASGELRTLTETLSGKEDYCWTPDGKIFMGKEGHLFVFDPENATKGWSDLGDLGIGDFYRLAVSPDGKYLTAVAFIQK